MTHEGPLYPLPIPESDGTGLGKPLKLIAKPFRERIPIHIAALGEKNVAPAANWLTGGFPYSSFPRGAHEVFGPSLDAGSRLATRHSEHSISVRVGWWR